MIADNTVPTPLLLKPIQHGADVVIHSLTKFIGGHGTTMGGIIIDGGTFPWAEHPDRFRCWSSPSRRSTASSTQRTSLTLHTSPGVEPIGLRNTGASLSPFNAFLHLQGLETLRRAPAAP